MLKYLLILFLVIIIAFAGGAYWVGEKLEESILTSDTITVEIPLNTSNSKIISKVNEHGGFQPDWLFKYVMRYYSKFEQKFAYAGYYKFAPGTKNSEILDAIYEGGRLRTVKVTFPEGLSIEEIADLLKPINTDKKRFIELAYSDSLLDARGIPGGSVLGYLLPETYEFFLYETADKVIDKMLDGNQNFWTEANKEKLDQVKLSKHQAITLASIVEAETPLKKEAPTVAGLYLNRLNKNMLLQADPTVQFVLGKKKRVLYKDLETDNPYNTYMYPGLPPGPINNPGKDALKAVLDPEKHKFLFMVAKGDGSGEHYFTKNNKSHLIYVGKYRRTRDSLRKANN